MVTLGWSVCPSVSMVTTSWTVGLEKTLLSRVVWPGLEYPIMHCTQAGPTLTQSGRLSE